MFLLLFLELQPLVLAIQDLDWTLPKLPGVRRLLRGLKTGMRRTLSHESYPVLLWQEVLQLRLCLGLLASATALRLSVLPPWSEQGRQLLLSVLLPLVL